MHKDFEGRVSVSFAAHNHVQCAGQLGAKGRDPTGVPKDDRQHFHGPGKMQKGLLAPTRCGPRHPVVISSVLRGIIVPFYCKDAKAQALRDSSGGSQLQKRGSCSRSCTKGGGLHWALRFHPPQRVVGVTVRLKELIQFVSHRLKLTSRAF